MPPVDPEVRRIILAYRDQAATLRARLIRYIEATWGRLGSWRDADIERWIAQVVPTAEGAQRTIAALTDAYLTAVESAVTGTRVAPVGVQAATVTTEALRGVPAPDVYRRAGVTVWTALSDGATLPDAVARGLTRATSIATTNLQLAKTHTSQQIIAGKSNVVGYRRVLEGPESCGLCIVASTQRYRREELMPIHGGCDCGVAPIYGDQDPGQVVDPDTLQAAHDAIQQRFGSFSEGARSVDARNPVTGQALQYRDVLITHHHGEIGPVLGVRGQTFTGPSDV